MIVLISQISVITSRSLPVCSNNKPPVNWTSGLREAIYRALNRYNDPDPYLRNHLHNIPIQHQNIIKEPLFGDIVVLAKGKIYQSPNRYYKILQDGCGPIECYPSNPVDKYDEIIGIWTVERIRQHCSPDYTYEFQYKVVPRNHFQKSLFNYDGEVDYSVPGHLYIVKVCSVKEHGPWTPQTITTPKYSVWVHRDIPKPEPTLYSIWNTRLNPKYTTTTKRDIIAKPTLQSVWVHQNVDRSFQVPSIQTLDQNGIKHTIRFPDFSTEVSNDDIFGGPPPPPPPTKPKPSSTTTTDDFFDYTLDKKFTTDTSNAEKFDKEFFNYPTTTTTKRTTTSTVDTFLGFNNDITTDRKPAFTGDLFDFLNVTKSHRKIPATLPSFILPITTTPPHNDVFDAGMETDSEEIDDNDLFGMMPTTSEKPTSTRKNELTPSQLPTRDLSSSTARIPTLRQLITKSLDITTTSKGLLPTSTSYNKPEESNTISNFKTNLITTTISTTTKSFPTRRPFGRTRPTPSKNTQFVSKILPTTRTPRITTERVRKTTTELPRTTTIVTAMRELPTPKDLETSQTIARTPLNNNIQSGPIETVIPTDSMTTQIIFKTPIDKTTQSVTNEMSSEVTVTSELPTEEISTRFQSRTSTEATTTEMTKSSNRIRPTTVESDVTTVTEITQSPKHDTTTISMEEKTTNEKPQTTTTQSAETTEMATSTTEMTTAEQSRTTQEITTTPGTISTRFSIRTKPTSTTAHTLRIKSNEKRKPSYRTSTRHTLPRYPQDISTTPSPTTSTPSTTTIDLSFLSADELQPPKTSPTNLELFPDVPTTQSTENTRNTFRNLRPRKTTIRPRKLTTPSTFLQPPTKFPVKNTLDPTSDLISMTTLSSIDVTMVKTIPRFSVSTTKPTTTVASTTEDVMSRRPFVPRQPRYRKNRYDLDSISNNHFYAAEITTMKYVKDFKRQWFTTEPSETFPTSQSISTSVSINIGKR